MRAMDSLILLRWLRAGALVSVVVAAFFSTGCCQTGDVDVDVDVPPEQQADSCFEICGRVLQGNDLDGLALCETSDDRTKVTCTFTYTSCPDALL